MKSIKKSFIVNSKSHHSMFFQGYKIWWNIILIILENQKKGIKSKISHVVVVDVKSFSEVTSPSYDLGIKKDDLVKKWKKYYN